MSKTAKCDFCNMKMPILDEYDSYELVFTELIPVPAINLTTGEQEKTADDPYYAMLLYEECEPGERASFPIKYCPLCGRKLKGERNEQT